MRLALIMFAGAAGAAARYGLTLTVQAWVGAGAGRGRLGGWFGPGFPLGTLVVNVAGTFLLALLVGLVLAGAVPAEWRLVLGTGFLGAFTTFSTFSLEAEGLARRGQWAAALAYVVGNLGLGLLAILVGRALAARLVGPGALGGP